MAADAALPDSRGEGVDQLRVVAPAPNCRSISAAGNGVCLLSVNRRRKKGVQDNGRTCVPVDDGRDLGRDVAGAPARDPVVQEDFTFRVTAHAVEQVVLEQVARGVAVVVREVVREEVGLVRRKVEAGAQSKSEVSEVELAAIGQDVGKVSIEVDKSARTHEGGSARQGFLHPAEGRAVPAFRYDGFAVVGQPSGECVRHMFQEEHQAARGLANGPQPVKRRVIPPSARRPPAGPRTRR